MRRDPLVTRSIERVRPCCNFCGSDASPVYSVRGGGEFATLTVRTCEPCATSVWNQIGQLLAVKP